MTSNSYLKRYLKLKELREILKTREILFRDPVQWDDKNDYFTLQKYKVLKKYETLLALCLTKAKNDKYFFWKTYVSCPLEGVCIVFKKDEFINSIMAQVVNSRNEKLLQECVQYPTIKQLHLEKYEIESLPFIKRFGYSKEEEYRFIYANKNITSKFFNLQLDTIERICLNPYINNATARTIKKEILNIKGCEKIKITRSGLGSSNKWKKAVESKFNVKT